MVRMGRNKYYKTYHIIAICLIVAWMYVSVQFLKSASNSIEPVAIKPDDRELQLSAVSRIARLKEKPKIPMKLPKDIFESDYGGFMPPHNLTNCSNIISYILPSRADNIARLFKVLDTREVWKNRSDLFDFQLPSTGLKTRPVFVTASSSNHFSELETAIRNFKINYMDKADTEESRYTLIVYDIGLEPKEIKLVREGCDFCELRNFSFSRYPGHVHQLTTYAWKPLLIYNLLFEYEVVIWCDSSVRFKEKPLSGIVRQARERGIAFYDAGFNVTCLTHAGTFAFFREEPCLFKTAFMVEANFIVWASTPFTRDVLGKAWAACALESTCIAPPGSRPVGCTLRNSPDYCDCHRYDQSVLTVLLYRLMAPGPIPAPWIKPQNNPWIYPESVCDIQRGDAGSSGFLKDEIKRKNSS